ncbi:MAG: hypothetical protein ABII22_04680 [Candidatus Micrarchaeota archaeon]
MPKNPLLSEIKYAEKTRELEPLGHWFDTQIQAMIQWDLNLLQKSTSIKKNEKLHKNLFVFYHNLGLGYIRNYFDPATAKQYFEKSIKHYSRIPKPDVVYKRWGSEVKSYLKKIEDYYSYLSASDA